MMVSQRVWTEETDIATWIISSTAASPMSLIGKPNLRMPARPIYCIGAVLPRRHAIAESVKDGCWSSPASNCTLLFDEWSSSLALKSPPSHAAEPPVPSLRSPTKMLLNVESVQPLSGQGPEKDSQHPSMESVA